MINYKKITSKEFELLLLNSNSLSKLCENLNLPRNGKSYQILKLMIEDFGLNTSHLIPRLNSRKYEHTTDICQCGKEYKKIVGSKKGDKKTCSTKCYNKYFMSGDKNPNWKQKKDCELCGKKLKKNTSRFCSSSCSAKKRVMELFEKIENGTFKFNTTHTSKNKTLKSYLVSKYGHKCFVCGLSEWMGKEIPLQLDHINGDCANDELSNIRNICPNCHAQTDTYCGKNAGKGKRKHRNEDYKKGKENW